MGRHKVDMKSPNEDRTISAAITFANEQMHQEQMYVFRDSTSGDPMLLYEMFETIGAVWLTLSAVAFVLFAFFAKSRQQSVTAIGRADSKEPISKARGAAVGRQVDKLRTTLGLASDESEGDRRRDTQRVPVDAE